MSKYIDSIYKIYNNPFVLTPLIGSFYEKLEKTPRNILLAYLVLPLVLNSQSKSSLQTIKITSSIHTFIDSSDKSKRANIFGLPDGVNRFREMTNQCLQHAIDNCWLKVQDDLSIEFIEKVNNNAENLRQSYKASLNLHKIFKDLDVVTIYRLLGLKKL